MVYRIDIIIAIGGTLNIIIQRLNKVNIPIIIYTDFLLLYKCLVKLGTTKKKRLIINILALREAYKRGDIDEIR